MHKKSSIASEIWYAGNIRVCTPYLYFSSLKFILPESFIVFSTLLERLKIFTFNIRTFSFLCQYEALGIEKKIDAGLKYTSENINIK